MFNTPTTFILGAGASWHYGYPTGEGLVKKVIAKAEEVALYFEFAQANGRSHLPDFLMQKIADSRQSTKARIGVLRQTHLDAKHLADRLRHVNPTLIDYFLKQNPDLHEIGKLIIAMVIFDCECAFFELGGNPNHHELYKERVLRRLSPANNPPEVSAFADDWLRFVLYKITSRCDGSRDLLSNKVTFVTFNYDTSLEQRLYVGLKNISLFEHAHILQFLSPGRVLHVYGKVREKIGRDWKVMSIALRKAGETAHPDVAKRYLDFCYDASLGIRTIDGPEKEGDVETLKAAEEAIEQAQKLFILGYGFDASNSERIGLTVLRQFDRIDRSIFFTNFGGHNRVSMAASRAMSDYHDMFLPRGSSPAHEFHLRCEMSTKNVYDALNEDFESLETD